MAKSVIDILIKVTKEGSGDKETVKQLVSLKQGYGEVMAVMGAAAGVAVALNQVYQNTVKVFMDYASQVRETSRLTGMSAEETSKLIQAADDLTISYESLNKALWAASKQGIDVSIDSLAGLADQYMALEDPAMRAEFLAKNFGKSGQEMGKLMEQGGQGVRQMTDAISGNLVLTDQAVRQAREYEIAVDNLSDTFEGLKVAAGNEAISPLNDSLKTLNVYLEENSSAVEKNENRLGKWVGLVFPAVRLLEMLGDVTQAHAEATRYSAEEITKWTDYGLQWEQILGATNEGLALSEEELKAQALAMQEVSAANLGMIGVIQQLQGETDSYNEKAVDLTQKLNGLTAEQRNYTAGSDEYNNLQTEIDETGQAIDDLATKHEEAGKRIAFSLLQQKMAVDGLTDAEFNGLMTVGVQWGIFDQTVVDSAALMDEQMKGMANAYNDPIEQQQGLNQGLNRMLALTGSSFDFYVNIHTRGAFPHIQKGTAYEEAGIVAGFAEGGQLGQGWAMVGEQGPELVSPKGFVFPNNITRALLDSGLSPENEFRIGGDLAGTGVFEGAGSGTPSPRPRKRKSTSSSVPSNVVNSEIGQASSAVANISAMADITAAAVSGSASVQQASVMQTQALVNTIQVSNESMSNEQRETNRLLREQSKNLPREMVAAMIQANP